VFLFFVLYSSKKILASTVSIIKRLSHCCACWIPCVTYVLYCHLVMLLVYLMHI
jgi:hypothetical protein